MPSSTTNTVTNFNVNGAANGYVRLPGVAYNYISSPDSTALSITGDIDIRARVALDDWTPATDSYLVAKWNAGLQNSYVLRVVATTGTLRLVTSPDGSTTRSAISTAAPVVADGATLWVRATRDSTTGTVTFYTASGALTNPAAGDFTQLGATVATTAEGMMDSTAVLELGTLATGGTAQTLAKFYRTQIYNGIAGTLVFDSHFTTKPVGANSFTESSSNAATVTINGVLAQAGDGRVSLVSSTPSTAATISKALGTVSCDYLSIQDSTATGGARYFAGTHSVNVSGNTGWNFIAPTYNTSSTGIIA